LVKRLLSVLLTAALMVGLMALPAAAGPLGLTVTFNKHDVRMDVQPTVVNGRTMVPFRAIFEKMGATVGYDAATQTITATRGGTNVSLRIGSTAATVNGQSRTLDVAPMIVGGRTLVPLRFVGEAFGARVDYDGTDNHVNITDYNYPKRGGTIYGALWSAPVQKLNPIITPDWYTGQVIGPIFSGLWFFDDKGTPTGDLATHWEVDENNFTITFYMRKDATFHDGRPVTAHDVALSYYGIMHPDYKGSANSGYDAVEGYEEYHKSGNKAHLTGLRVLNDYTLQWKLTKPDAPFFINNTSGVAIPRHLYENVPVADWGTSKDPNNAFPIGSGPFKFSAWAEGQYAILKRNESYYRGEVYLDQIIYRVMSTDVALGAFSTGDIHYGDVNVNDLDALSRMPHIEVMEYPGLVWQHMTFNNRQPYLQDKRVRQAIAYLIDRPTIIRQLLRSHGSTMYTPIHPLTWAFSDDVQKYEKNPQKAAELLAEAGYTRRADGWYKDGQKLKLRLLFPSGNPVRMATAPVVQQWLGEAGIEVVLERYDFGTLIPKLFEDWDFDLAFLGWAVSTPEPDPRWVAGKANIGPDQDNFSGWYTDKSEELMERAVRTLDLEERIEIYREWQQHFTDEVPFLVLYATNEIKGRNKKFMNYRPTPFGEQWNIEEWWWDR
jgi:peptide/nickel transport system substrate-binding protein